MFRNVFGGCVSDRSSRTEAFRSSKLKFGVPIGAALKNGYLPEPLVDILVYIAKEGVATADVFRRPGNPNDIRRIVKRLSEGKQVIYTNYSFYTLASVVKKFLLKTPGGVLTEEGEETLLQVLTLGHKTDQCHAVNEFIESLTEVHQQLLALLFGTWFRIISYSEVNFMSVEALSRSVAGSMFHTCAEDPAKVEKASRILQLLIDNFGVAAMFGRHNIQYFAETTHTGVHIRELMRYQYQYPSEETIPLSPDIIEVTRLEGSSDHEEPCGIDSDEGRAGGDSPELSPLGGHRRQLPSSDTGNDGDVSQLTINVSTLSAPEVSLMPSPEVSKRPKSLEDNLNEMRSFYQSRCLSRFNSVKRKQLERLRQRSDWFLSPSVARTNGSNGSGTYSLGRYFQHSHHHHPYPSKKNGSGKNGGGCGGNGCGGSGGCGGSSNNSGNSMTKASSEGTVLEAYSDADSVFTDHSSRSESPASEPVWSHVLQAQSRDIINSDTLAEVASPHIQHSQHHEQQQHHHHHHHRSHHRHRRHHHHHRRQVSDLSHTEFVRSLEAREKEEEEEREGGRVTKEGSREEGDREEEEEEDGGLGEDQRVGGLVTDESETEMQCYVMEQQYGAPEGCS
ncbi:uncharacterized protein LOC143297743 isoform X2 [Babylonia areolata]|uniref:uncharacterized protein LOC143297743 isoform X2 n=1 Tax=Babylonia areolata TaxID=304850 RepID=UPI003FD07834